MAETKKPFDAARLGRKGGSAKSDRKTVAARLNASKGGRKGGRAKSKRKTLAVRINGRKGGHPYVYHLAEGYSFTSSAKIIKNKIPCPISQEQLSTLKRAFDQGNFRLALVKVIRFRNELDHDPDLTEEQEYALTHRR